MLFVNELLKSFMQVSKIPFQIFDDRWYKLIRGRHFHQAGGRPIVTFRHCASADTKLLCRQHYHLLVFNLTFIP